jgi:deazaflavin-dependent oxidoreductase (nitroreductase family)
MVKYQRPRGPFLEWVRQLNKAIFNRLFLTFAGRHVFAVVQHIGRRSGHVYTTPVVTVPIANGFIIPLTFGADTDWCRNVLAAGQCTLQSHGQTYTLSGPEVIGLAEAHPLLPRWARLLIRIMPLDQFLMVRRG